MKPSDANTAKLLRWYPRAWRERYGEEFLAMIEDGLDGRRPGWRLLLSVVWAGLRERGHQVRLASQRGVPARARRRRTGMGDVFGGGIRLSVLPDDFRASPSPARAWRATVVLDAVIALAVLGGVAVLAGVLLALPTFARSLRADGWPQIRRRARGRQEPPPWREAGWPR